MTDSSSSLVDWSAAMEMVSGDRDLLTEVVQVLIQDLPRLRSGIETAIGEHESEALRRSAHSLKGSVRFLGDNKVFEIAQHLEQMGANDDWDGVADAHSSLDVALTKIVPELEEFCRS